MKQIELDTIQLAQGQYGRLDVVYTFYFKGNSIVVKVHRDEKLIAEVWNDSEEIKIKTYY